MSHYAAGANFERRVRDRLYADGAKLVVRSAGSKGPVDLVALYQHVPLTITGSTEFITSLTQTIGAPPQLIQVKRGRSMTKAARAELVALAESVGARAVLASPEKNGRRIDVKLEVLA